MASDKSEWELSEFGNLIETENEKYGEITQIAERRRTGEKYVKIRKIRQEMTWGVRVTKTLIICYCGPYVAYKESILAELVPPFQFYLRDKQFYTTYKGTPFRLPDGYTFKFYENAVECWYHNAILSDEKQLKILVRYNFDKFVRVLETIGEPTAATIQYDYDTCVSSISPFSESEDEEGETDDEDDRNESEEQDHSINKIFPFSFSGDEETESDDEDERSSEREEQEHSINKIFPFSFSSDEESESDSKSDCSDESKSVAEFDDGDEPDEEEEHDQSDDDLPMMVTPFSESDNEDSESYYESDDEDKYSEGGKHGDNSIVEISSFSESVYEGGESDSESHRSDEYKSVAKDDHEDEPDEEEEHDQSDDDLPMLIFQFSESDDEESESYNGSDDEDEQSEEEELDEITEDQEEMYFAKAEDNDKKFDSEDAPSLQLLHCREEVSQKCDAEEFDLGILFGAEERDHNLNSVKVSSLCSLVEKVEPDDVWDSEDESNKDQFNEIEAQGPPNQKQQQQHCSEHVMEHRPSKNTKKRKNILMGWVCSRILKMFIKSQVLL